MSVSNYNASGLGKIDLLCGDSKSGYVHIRSGHQGDWQKIIDKWNLPGNWDDLMEFATRDALEHPSSGYPTDVGGGKYCYTSVGRIKKADGTGPTLYTYHPSVIVSTNNKKVITSIPTTTTNCGSS